MNKDIIMGRIDSVIRFFLYLLIFWLPYSPAVVETCVITSFVLWTVKRFLLVDWQERRKWNFFRGLMEIGKCFSLPSTFLNLPIFFFLLAAFLSATGSAFLDYSIRGLITKTTEWFVVYFLVVEAFKDKKHLRIAIFVFVFSAMATCLDAIIQFYITGKDIFNARELARGGATAAFKHPNTLGGFLNFIVLFSFVRLFLRDDNLPVRLLWISNFLFSLWALILSSSRGAWIGISAGVIYSLFLLKRKIVVICLVCSIALMVSFVFLSPPAKRFVRLDSHHLTETVQWRKNVWIDSGVMIRDKPLFGHGINTYMNLFQQYRRKFQGNYPYSPTYAHNCYLQLACEMGILGLACFFWILIRFFRKVRKTIAQENRPQFCELRNLCIALSSGTFAFLIHSFFDTNLYSLQLSILIWYMIGLAYSIFNLLNHSRNCDKKIT